MPVMLGWFADSPDPDAGLFGFRRLSESLGSTPVVPRHPPRRGPGRRAAGPGAGHLPLRDHAHRARAAGRADARRGPHPSRRDPADVRDDRVGRAARTTSSRRVRSIRAIRRRELLRLAAGDLFGEIDVADVGAGLSRLTDATLEATLDAVGRAVREQQGLDRGADRDGRRRHGPVRRLRAVLRQRRRRDVRARAACRAPTRTPRRRTPRPSPTSCAACSPCPMTDPALEVDADLRPEGKQGPLVRTLDSYAAYYAKWSKVWESQALLRADAVVGDEGLRRRFTELIDPLRFPADGLTDADVAEVRRVKARVDRRAAAARRRPQHPPQAGPRRAGRHRVDGAAAADAARGRRAGAAHAAHPRRPGARPPRPGCCPPTTPTCSCGPGGPSAGSATRSRSCRARAATSCRATRGPRRPMAAVLGYPPGGSDEMVNDYLRTTRRARAVVDRVFWG